MRRAGLLLSLLILLLGAGAWLALRTGEPAEEAALSRMPRLAVDRAREFALPEGGRTLVVHCTAKSSGEPVADARVYWASAAELSEMRSLLEWDDWKAFGGWFALLGHTTRTDPNGRAFVPWPTAPSQVLVEKGDLRGYHHFQVAPASSIEVQLEKVTKLDVQVVDRHRKPVGGAFVALCAMDVGLSSRSAVYTSTLPAHAASGVATFELHPEERNFDVLPPPLRRENDIYVAHPFAEPIGATVDIRARQEALAVLELPAYGSLRIHLVDEQGMRVDRRGYAGAECEPLGYRFDHHARRGRHAFEQGETVLPVVGLGLRLKVVVTLQDELTPLERVIDGPRREGEETRVDFVVPPAPFQIQMQLLTPDGEPLSKRRVSVKRRPSPSWQRNSSDDSILTDGEGRLALTPHPARESDASPSLELLVSDCGRHLLLHASIPCEGPLTAPIDLGVVRLEVPPPLAAGRIVDARGLPVAGTLVRIRHGRNPAIATEEHGVGWGMGPLRARSRENGGFEIVGALSPGDLELVVGENEEEPLASIPFARGSRNLEVPLGGGIVEGRVLLPEGELYEELFASLHRVPANGDRSQRSYLGPPLTMDESGSFRFVGVPSGELDLALRIGRSSVEPRWIEGLVVREGERCADPRLAAIDFFSRLRTLRIAVRDGDGRAIPEALVAVQPMPSRLSSSIAHAAHAGSISLVVPVGPVEVVARAEGFLPRVEVVDGGFVSLVLARPYRIRIRLADGVELPPAPYRLELELSPRAEGGHKDWRARYFTMRDGHGGWTDSSRWIPEPVFGDRIFDASRELLLEVRSVGSYSLQFVVADTDANHSSLRCTIGGSLTQGSIDLHPSPADQTVIAAPEPITYSSVLASLKR